MGGRIGYRPGFRRDKAHARTNVEIVSIAGDQDIEAAGRTNPGPCSFNTTRYRSGVRTLSGGVYCKLKVGVLYVNTATAVKSDVALNLGVFPELDKEKARVLPLAFAHYRPFLQLSFELLASIHILNAIALVLERRAVGALHAIIPAVLALLFRCGHTVWLEIISDAVTIRANRKYVR